METRVTKDTEDCYECVTEHGNGWSVRTLLYKGSYVRVDIRFNDEPTIEAIRWEDGRTGFATLNHHFPEYSEEEDARYGRGAWFNDRHAPPLTVMQEFFIRYLETEI